MRWCPSLGIKSIDGLVLSHDHADAYGGLDDLRDWTWHMDTPLPTWASEQHAPSMFRSFPWTLQRGMATGGGQVAKLQMTTFPLTPGHSINVLGLEMVALPVQHGVGTSGEAYLTCGFRFLHSRDDQGALTGGVVYVPDCSAVPDQTRPLMENADLLVLDALRLAPTHKSHFTLTEAVQESIRLKPKHTLLTDFCHRIDHERESRVVRDGSVELDVPAMGGKVELAYDGLSLSM